MKFQPFKLWFALALLAGCGEPKHGDHAGHSRHGHQHTPPHGGTPVVLGNEDYHLEFVLDPAGGKLQAYVLDSHMDKFIRLTNESFTVSAKPNDKPETLVFRAAPNAATGEKVGDTALFEAQADWLKTVKSFEVVLDELTVRGRKFEKIAFNFPKGNAPAGGP